MHPPRFQDLRQELTAQGVRPSYQRLKILEYLINNQCHPTVGQIHQCLLPDIPTLSKATVYNTLKILAEVQLVKIINMEDHENRYDINTQRHGHFLCESCGTISDFTINIDDFIGEELNDYSVKEKAVYFKGICPRCL